MSGHAIYKLSDLAGKLLSARIQQEVDVFQAGGGWEGSKDKVVLGQTLLSLLWMPAFNDWIRQEYSFDIDYDFMRMALNYGKLNHLNLSWPP